VKLKRRREQRTTKWGDGSGVSYEIVAWPDPLTWQFRLSMVEINGDGPFSVLEGVDRYVMSCDEEFTLHVGDTGIDPERLVGISLDRAAPVRVELIGGPVRIVEGMMRRDSGLTRPIAETLRVMRFDKGEAVTLAESYVALVVEGALEVSTPGAGFPFNPSHERVVVGDALLLPALAPGAAGRVSAVVASTVIAIDLPWPTELT
jgi:environmental stress-induced protein Ves